MTGRPLDHVVVAVRDLDAASRTYETLGFLLTPKATHPDHMGTSNRLAQFRGRCFIELLEVDRPALLASHDFDRTPPFFSFGDHNRQVVKRREGMSMLAFAGKDARSDVERFAASGIPTFAPFDFGRQAQLPDGRSVPVSFTLGFAQSPETPQVAFFVCQDNAQELFWKSEFQVHENGALDILKVFLASDRPERDAGFIGSLFGGGVTPVEEGFAVACGEIQQVVVCSFDSLKRLDASFSPEVGAGALLAGLELRTEEPHAFVPSGEAHGVFISCKTVD